MINASELLRRRKSNRPTAKFPETYSRLCTIVSARTAVAVEDITGTCRLREYSYAKQLVRYLLFTRFQYTYVFIARNLKRDHTTIMDSVLKINQMRAIYPKVQEDLDFINEALNY